MTDKKTTTTRIGVEVSKDRVRVVGERTVSTETPTKQVTSGSRAQVTKGRKS